jgi:hypothetical protein
MGRQKQERACQISSVFHPWLNHFLVPAARPDSIPLDWGFFAARVLRFGDELEIIGNYDFQISALLKARSSVTTNRRNHNFHLENATRDLKTIFVDAERQRQVLSRPSVKAASSPGQETIDVKEVPIAVNTAEFVKPRSALPRGQLSP